MNDRDKTNRMQVLAAVGLSGGRTFEDVHRLATREVVDQETGRRRPVMTEAEFGQAAFSLIESGRIVRTGAGRYSMLDRSEGRA